MSGERGSEDLSEGEVFGGAACALLPVEEELAVAVGEARGGVDLEFRQGVINPVRRAFEFGVISNGSLVDDEMGYGVGDGIDVGPLRAKFFIDECGRVTKLLEDGCKGWAILYCCFGFDTYLIAGTVRRFIARALMRDGPLRPVVTEAKKLTLGAEIA